MALAKAFVTSVEDGLNEIKEFLSKDLLSEHLQPLNEKKRKDSIRLIENLLTTVHSVNPSLRPRMNTPQSGPKPALPKPPVKSPVPPMVPRTLSPTDEENDQEEYLPMQPGSPEIEPEDYEAPAEVVMPDGSTLGSGAAGGGEQPDPDELYEELPAEDGAHDQDDDIIEPEDYEDPASAAASVTSLNPVPLPPKFEEPGYQPTGKPAEDNTDAGPWQYAKTMRDKRVSTKDLMKATCKGTLEKLGGRGHSTWQKRFCVLDSGLLYFFKDEKSKNYNNFIEAFAYEVCEAPQKTKEKKHQFSFSLTCRQSGKDYYFRTASSADRERWINAINGCSSLSSPLSPAASMHTMKRGDVHATIAAAAPVVDDFDPEFYEELPAADNRISSEGESEEDSFEHSKRPKQVAAPVVPKMQPPPPPPPSDEQFDQDELYDEHPLELPVEEPEEEYLACEGDLQQDIIESAASPIDISVDTNRIYEATNNGVDLEAVYVSLYNFTAEEDDEMSLQRGDLVAVVDSNSSPNWWLAELITEDIMHTNKKGYCPANFLTLAFEQL